MARNKMQTRETVVKDIESKPSKKTPAEKPSKKKPAKPVQASTPAPLDTADREMLKAAVMKLGNSLVDGLRHKFGLPNKTWPEDCEKIGVLLAETEPAVAEHLKTTGGLPDGWLVSQPAEEKDKGKPGPKLKDRDLTGLKPDFMGKSKVLTVVPEKVTVDSVVEWVEGEIDAYHRLGQHLTNDALKASVQKFISAYRSQYNAGKENSGMTLSEIDCLTHTVNGLIASRPEPEEWSREYRAEQAMKALQGTKKVDVPKEKGKGKDKPASSKGKPKPNKTSGDEDRPTLSNVDATVANIGVKVEVGDRGAMRCNLTIDGETYPVTAVIRHMGHTGWKFAEVRDALKKLGIDAHVKDATCRAQLYSGVKGDDGPHGKLPKLTGKGKKLVAALKK